MQARGGFVRRAAFVFAAGGAASACGGLLGFGSDDPPPPAETEAADAATDEILVPEPGDTTVPVTLDAGGDADAADAEAGAPVELGCQGDAGCVRYVFVTSETFAATALGLAAADAKCEAAKKKNLLLANRKFVAWISEDGAPARLRFQADAPIRRLDGQTVATSLGALLGAGALVPIDRTETGAALAVGNMFVWTGTQNDGNPNQTCGDWTDEGVQGKRGSANETGTKWTDDDGMACTFMARLYCFEY